MSKPPSCANHADRAGTLAIDLPSMGIQTHLCDECKAALTSSLSQFKGKREAWDHSGYDHMSIGNTHYVRSTGGYFEYSCGDEPKGLYK